MLKIWKWSSLIFLDNPFLVHKIRSDVFIAKWLVILVFCYILNLIKVKGDRSDWESTQKPKETRKIAFWTQRKHDKNTSSNFLLQWKSKTSRKDKFWWKIFDVGKSPHSKDMFLVSSRIIWAIDNLIIWSSSPNKRKIWCGYLVWKL